MAQPLDGLHIYANPPWSLIAPLLRRLQSSPTAEATLVLPYWESAVWFPRLLEMADDIRIMSPTHDTFLPGANGNSTGIGKPHWAVLFAHIPRRA